MKKRNGLITYEWMLLIIMLVIGVVGGLAVLRDATVMQCAEIADSVAHHNKSYEVEQPLTATLHFSVAADAESPQTAEISKGGSTVYQQPEVAAATSLINAQTYEK